MSNQPQTGKPKPDASSNASVGITFMIISIVWVGLWITTDNLTYMIIGASFFVIGLAMNPMNMPVNKKDSKTVSQESDKPTPPDSI